jgi:hypothetical protein
VTIHPCLATGPTFAPLILGIVLVVVALSKFYQFRQGQSRSEKLRPLATQLQFDNFNPEHDEAFAEGWGFLSRLNQGTNRYAFNVMRGTYQEQALFIFDYHYQTGSGKNREEHSSTVLLLVCKHVFPHLTIAPETLGEKIASAVGIGDDIKFESAEFSRMYYVRSPDKKFAYDVCHPQMMEYLLQYPGLKVEMQGPALLLAFEPPLPVDKIEARLQQLAGIRSRLPEYLFAT